MNRVLFLVFLFVFVAASRVSAKDLFVEDNDAESSGSIVDLGRRSKSVVAKLKNNVIGDKIDPKAVLNLDSGLGVFDAFFASLSMILVSEIGDETFIIAALMAMRHPKSIVLSGALSALFVMTILSTGLGRIVPNLISRKHTNSAATGMSQSFVLRSWFKDCQYYSSVNKNFTCGGLVPVRSVRSGHQPSDEKWTHVRMRCTEMHRINSLLRRNSWGDI